MAIDLVAESGVATMKLQLDFQDVFRQSRMETWPVVAAMTIDDVKNVITDVEAISECKICHVVFNGVQYRVTGGKAAATDGDFASTKEEANLKYSSAADCRSGIGIRIPGPKAALFTGLEKILVDPNNANLVTFNTEIVQWLVNKDGDHDMIFERGYRTALPLPVPNVA